MVTETIDELLRGIVISLDSTKASVEEIIKGNQKTEHSQLIKDLMNKLQVDKLEGVSLLTLKNQSLLSYLNNLILIVLSHLDRLDKKNDYEEIEKLKLEAVVNTITQRVTLEKGIKPLEKKLNYQLDKMVRSYNRMIADDEKIESKLNKMQDKDLESSSDANGEDEDDEDEDEDEEDDNLAYKPDFNALAKLSKSQSKSKSVKNSHSDKESNEKYKPPKISAVAPPTTRFEESRPQKDGRKLQSMEEYLRENSDLPQMESSIGATIVDNGRGGVKTAFEKEREKEIQSYEESNFIRLPNAQTKKSFKQKQKEMVNTFGGEDWSMFNNKRNLNEGTSRKRKPTSAWDRAKRKRT